MARRDTRSTVSTRAPVERVENVPAYSPTFTGHDNLFTGAAPELGIRPASSNDASAEADRGTPGTVRGTPGVDPC